MKKEFHRLFHRFGLSKKSDTPLENKQIISIKREKKEKKMLDIRFIRENPDVVKEKEVGDDAGMHI